MRFSYRILNLIIFCFFNLYLSGQVYINEFQASNASTISDPQYNEFSDWIELYNGGNSSVNITGWYLTDKKGSLPGWKFPSNTVIPAKGFLMVWADGQNSNLHTDFKLSADGEEVLLYDNSGNEIDQIIFSAQKSDVSMGRKPDGSTTIGLFEDPTPGASNNQSKFYNGVVEQVPVFSIPGGFYNNPVRVDIRDLYKKGTVRYTIDGSDPMDTSATFSQSLDISSTTVVKARMFYPNLIPGPIITHTYFINEKFEDRKLPVLSLSTHSDYFYGKDSGLYVQSFKPTWEYPIHLEFYQKDGILGFHHDAGVQVGGLNAWILPQKLLNIYSRKKYGNGNFSFQLFNQNKRNEFGDFILRCSGNDWSNTFFRDGLMQGLIKKYANLDGQDFRPCIVFINGKYLGLHNIREKQDADYCKYYYNIDQDSLDYIENNVEVKEGTINLYNLMVDRLNKGVVSDSDFALLEGMMDTHNYSDYIISQIFSANTSWGHNISCFRSKSNGGKWRWLLHDYDRGFDLANVNSTGMDWATTTNGQDYSNPAWATLFLRKMLQNEKYKQYFITRFADHLFVTYNRQSIQQKVNDHYKLIANEMPYQIARWAGTTSSYGDAIPTLVFWQNEVEKLNQYGIQRNSYLWNDLNSFFSLNGTSTLQLEVSNNNHGFILFHDFKIPSYPWSGQYFQEREVTLTAVSKPGYYFDHWEKINYKQDTLIASKGKWKYRDASTPPPNNWKMSNFDDSNWSQGNAELGYGDGDEATVISYGPDANNKIPTYYFRNYFQIINRNNISSIIIRLKIDDGAVVYINGVEVTRYNLNPYPSNISFDTLALSAVSGTAENSYNEFLVPISILVNGSNCIAVEVHQSSRSSSDLSFDAELITNAISSTNMVSDRSSYTFKHGSNGAILKAVFQSSGTCGFLPDTVYSNLTLTQSCSPYIASGNVVINSNATLFAEPGVEIRFPRNANLEVHGNLQFLGTESKPIKINGLDSSTVWGGVFLIESSASSDLQHVIVSNASAGIDRTYFPAAISCYRSDLKMDHLDISKVTDNPIYARFSKITLTNSNLKSVVTGDCINVKQGYGYVENCTFEGGFEPDMDAIDYDGVDGGVVRNNVIHDFRGDNNDGLDIGEQCKNLSIENNFIYHCYDKGISVGQQSTARVINNVIAYTSIGVALKDESQVDIDHCTLFGNQQGISAYEKNSGYLGGNGIIKNTIVSNALTDAYISDSYSSIDYNKCMSDLDSSSMTQGDLIANPLFENPTNYDFHLRSNSPAIDAGTNGTDLGALNIPKYTGLQQIMISEILYDDSLSHFPEYIELYNPSSSTIDISGYTISEAIDFTFPEGTKINDHQAIVVTRNKSDFVGVNYPVFEWTSGKLKNEGERINLYDRSGILIDFVNYNNKSPWPWSNQLLGRSIEIKGSDLDNHFGSNWKSSKNEGGTPGYIDYTTKISTVLKKEMSIYPNPAFGNVILESNTPWRDPDFYIYDQLGRQVISQKVSGAISSYNLDIKLLESGIYEIVVKDKSNLNVFRSKLLVYNRS